jgi:hypothetical protein
MVGATRGEPGVAGIAGPGEKPPPKLPVSYIVVQHPPRPTTWKKPSWNVERAVSAIDPTWTEGR